MKFSRLKMFFFSLNALLTKYINEPIFLYIFLIKPWDMCMCVCVHVSIYVSIYTHTVLFSSKVSYQESWLKNKCQPSNSSCSKYRKSVSILGKYYSLLILGNIYQHWYNFYLVGHQR